MKAKTTLLILFPLLLTAQSVKPDLSWVDKEVAAIKPPRKGISNTSLVGVKDPFATQLMLNRPVIEEKDGTAKKSVRTFHAVRDKTGLFSLEAIFNANKARINGKWYQLDDKIYGYAVKHIDQHGVLLQKKKKKIKLSLKTKNDKIKINAK